MFRRYIRFGALNNWAVHIDGLNYVYQKLADDYSRRKLLEVLAYRILGHNKVKLSTNNPSFWAGVKVVQTIGDQNDVIPNVFKGEPLQKFDLRSLGFEVTMFAHPLNIIATYLLQQYSYRGPSRTVKVGAGDVVLDCGGCWGDTALYFAGLTGQAGQVHVFEFNSTNLQILTTNLDLNPTLMDVVQMVNRPLWSTSGLPVYVIDKGPGSTVSFEKLEGAEEVSTITIDDYLASKGDGRIDFIKMDIEGAELEALKGAEKSIRAFRPSLAIAIYHKAEHFYQIMQWIDQLDLGYKFTMDHYTIHTEETMLFASTKP